MSIDKAVDSSVLDAGLTAIAGAVRSKGGTSAQLSFPSGIVTAIGNIHTGITPAGTKTITANGSYDVTEFASAAVNVHKGEHYEVWEGIYPNATSAASDYNVIFTADNLPQSFKDHWQDDSFSILFKMISVVSDITTGGWYLTQVLSNSNIIPITSVYNSIDGFLYMSAARRNNGAPTNQNSNKPFREVHTLSNYGVTGQICYQDGELRQYQIAGSYHIPAGTWVLLWSW